MMPRILHEQPLHFATAAFPHLLGDPIDIHDCLLLLVHTYTRCNLRLRAVLAPCSLQFFRISTSCCLYLWILDGGNHVVVARAEA
jgi:hypothetical protein